MRLKIILVHSTKILVAGKRHHQITKVQRTAIFVEKPLPNMNQCAAHRNIYRKTVIEY